MRLVALCDMGCGMGAEERCWLAGMCFVALEITLEIYWDKALERNILG